MATLSAMYNNQLGDVHDAFVQVDAKREVIMALGKLLVGYSLNDAYDIRLTHKHFDISDGERVVGFGGKDMMLSTICKDGDEIPRDLLRKYNIDLKPDGAVTPSDYFISDDGEAIPYEFVYGDNEVAGNQGHGKLTEEFLTAWSAILRDYGLGGLLGLSVRDDSVPVSAHEKSDPEARLNMLYYEEPTEEEKAALLTTTWRIGEVNGIIEAKQCNYCYDLQYHHKNCTAPGK
ncbi:hypothetical protein ONZ43_g3766 [Nemania bipapillata]|uniref:Uncharacterized protein n=1 Tax=Nemania bipapillata TaxID=110536 RepID=A0ACC2IVW5_9PEZI|nr:hypothetical protein ONZ43_g3766 [Nemania bipapillata]